MIPRIIALECVKHFPQYRIIVTDSSKSKLLQNVNFKRSTNRFTRGTLGRMKHAFPLKILNNYHRYVCSKFHYGVESLRYSWWLATNITEMVTFFCTYYVHFTDSTTLPHISPGFSLFFNLFSLFLLFFLLLWKHREHLFRV